MRKDGRKQSEVTELAPEAMDGTSRVNLKPDRPLAGEPEISDVFAERDAYLDQLQRSLAEFANYRKRVDQERLHARRIANRDLLANLVPVVDDFHRALANVPADEADASWVQGVKLIERKLTALLEREGVQPIQALGQPFDPALHEAVAVEPGSSGSTVVEVYQNGYLHGEQLLRPAMVKVGDLAESGQPNLKMDDVSMNLNEMKGEQNTWEE